jgi:phospholipase/carboxylesterase
MSTTWIHHFTPGESPTVLALHGTGGDENDLIPLAKMIAPGAAILSPRGKVLENGAPRFFRRLAEGVFDQEDLRARTGELAAFVAEAAAEYRFDPAQVYAIGYSNGANIAASLLLSSPDVLAGAVLFRPMVPFEPINLPDLSNKRIFISSGRQDPIVPHALTERLATLLRESRADVTTVWQQAGHGLIQREVTEAASWFARKGTT